jgi:hypothetical protein
VRYLIDTAVAEERGRMSGIRPVPVIDGLRAAPAVTNDLTLVTRNDRRQGRSYRVQTARDLICFSFAIAAGRPGIFESTVTLTPGTAIMKSLCLASLLLVLTVNQAAAVAPIPSKVEKLQAVPVYYYHGRYYRYRYHGVYYHHRVWRAGRWHYY